MRLLCGSYNTGMWYGKISRRGLYTCGKYGKWRWHWNLMILFSKQRQKVFVQSDLHAITHLYINRYENVKRIIQTWWKIYRPNLEPGKRWTVNRRVVGSKSPILVGQLSPSIVHKILKLWDFAQSLIKALTTFFWYAQGNLKVVRNCQN